MENIYHTDIAYFLIGFFIIVTTRETSISLISLTPGAIYYLIMDDINSVTFTMYSIMFILSISFLFAKFFSNNFISRITTYPIFIVAAVII